MAQLGNLLVTGSSRLLGKLFCNDISVGNSLSVKTLSATNFTATSITTSGLTVNGNTTTTGTLNVGNSQVNGKISINGKVSIRDYANNGWLGINDTLAWTNGVYFGKTTVRTDGIFQVGDAGNKVLFNQSSAKFSVPVTINNSLAANNITATNVTVNDTLKAFKYELNTIQDLGGEFCVAPTIYIQSGAKVQVNKDSATTIVVSIKDTNAIKSDTIQGVRWAEKSKIKFQGKINGLSIRCNGIMKSKLNTVQNTMSLILTVDSNIANSFSTSVANATSYSDISVMLYQRVTKNSQAKDVYYPVGIRMSATGNANSAPYVDIWGSKSNSDPDTVYTVPSVRLGYLDGLKCGTYDCFGYGLYADNVYLNGTIISNSGTIGGFKIDNNSLNNGTWGTDKSVLVCTGTNIAKAVGGSSAINGWCFTAGSKFGVTTNGDLYASNANISGTITSEKGKIGKYTITGTSLWTGDGSTCSGIGGNQAFWAGSDSSNDAAFRVSYSGELVATNANITGTINTNDITATSGTIGSFKLDSTYLQSSDKTVGLSASSSDWAFWAGGFTSDTAKFRVTRAGQLYTRNITATGGTIGGWNINDNNIMSDIVIQYSEDGTMKSDRYRAYLRTAQTICTDMQDAFTIDIKKSGEEHFETCCSIDYSGLIKSAKGIKCTQANDVENGKYNIYRSILSTSELSLSLTLDQTSKNDIIIGEKKRLRAYIDSDNAGVLTTNKLYISKMESFELTGVMQIRYGIYNDTDTWLKGSTEMGNWYVDKTRISSSKGISMGSGGAGLILCDEDGKPVIWIQNENSKLTFRVDRDGTMYHNDNVLGEVITKTVGEKSMRSGTWTDTGASVTLPAGKYVVNGTVLFNSAANGQRGARFATSSTDYFRESQQINIAGTSKAVTSVQCVYIANFTTETKINLQGIQSSGAALSTINSYIQAIRIS